MLKRIPVLRLLICLMLVCASACVSPAHASSAGIIITHAQAGGTRGATQEFVALYNNTHQEVDITDWCLRNKNGANFACFASPAENMRRYMPPYGMGLVASVAYIHYVGVDGEDATLVYEPLHATNGSITGSSDMISLVTATGGIVDTVSWSTGLAAGVVLERMAESGWPLAYVDTDSTSDWRLAESMESADLPYDQTELRSACPDGETFSQILVEELELHDGAACVEPSDQPEDQEPERPTTILITELLPNAGGSDTGREYIEFYNPNNFIVDLAMYTLLVGPHLEKSYQLPAGISLGPFEYRSISNAQIPFSLLNTSSRVAIASQDVIVSETPAYTNPKDDSAWALVEGSWQYSNKPTPGAANQASVEEEDTTMEEPAPKPCASGQYRNPSTNRCRLLATSNGGTLKPCKDNQYRSEETNRCRNIDGSDGEPAPCKEGQERNPETNRCRTITKMSNADFGVLGAQTTSGGGNGYIWAAVGGVVLLAAAYATWEWREELGKVWQRLVKFVRMKK